MKHAPVLLALASLFLTVGHAASAPTPPENLMVCTRMADPGERLRCYDTQMTAMGAVVAIPPPQTTPPASSPPPAVVTAPKTEVAAAPPGPAASSAAPPPVLTAEQKFGADNLPPAARAKVEKVEKPDKVLVSTIASIRQVRPKLWLIVLANGQIWLQDGTQITMFFRDGYDVRIEKGLLSGDYRMSTVQTGDKNWVRVSRVQ